MIAVCLSISRRAYSAGIVVNAGKISLSDISMTVKPEKKKLLYFWPKAISNGI
jgi:hypothetical protein